MTSSRTGDAPGDEGSDSALTGAGGGTARDRGHQGEPRPEHLPHDSGATDEAARELDEENESEPTRSE
ncbi:hypothetical protein GCM10009836_47470 [Pseudonocardia ailaonensis]|uniref:Uncharacterized protein n=1 Tax=Pseudonocardia ailaonensis TaxID=367279 RepID=A0ABN2NBN4_9PSEU